ncbi:type II secretion system protein GspJ [Hahella sp. KA22]|uniref:type II secretion system minor pseudopilin GspJ n=1 Tax=Hahella sp. KA22 TaxID=1628392 RepID=UPI000FDF2474|nr:type II secretion system minor pseudopilin GspJ [Hahella sp. KA22]AZZ92026.1 type II secretion system protein GspJ [Hahella sp. KA22]QAY55397.1 type II secretion system protein GspJ [Hahella sp. KA22]
MSPAVMSSQPAAVKTRSRERGFTLLEVLIAVTITAIIGTAAFQFLGQGIRNKKNLETKSESLEEIQKAQRVLEGDLGQIVARSVRGEYGDEFYSVTNLNALKLIEFSRTGWRDTNDLLELITEDEEEISRRSNLQRVSYELEENTLYREYWEVMDRAQDSQPLKQRLLTHVKSVKFRFMDKDNQWHNEWPTEDMLTNQNEPAYLKVPKALEITLDHEKFGSIRRIYQVAGWAEIKDTANGGGNGGTSGGGSGGNNSGGDKPDPNHGGGSGSGRG